MEEYIEVTDINVGELEKDIKILKEIAEGFWERIGLNLLEPHKEEILKRKMEAIENTLARLEQDERVIEEAIEFIKDNCIEEIADMKGHYREVASIGDLEELLNILKRN